PSALRLHVLLTTVHSSAYRTSGMGLVLGGRARVVLTGHADASWLQLCYFLARELQQRGQLCLAYMASQANIADVFTKALQPCDHQPCFAFLDWSCDLLLSPTLPMGLCQTYICYSLFRL
ncbi:unnamed protein product, partial [Closterium sp. NIES-53]